MSQEVATAIPLLEAVEHAASRAGVPVDARLESGRTPIHALERPSPVVLIERCGTPFGGDTVPEQEARLAPRARVYIKEENNLERRATAQADRRPNIEQR
jgi:hypothetical protein